MQRVCDLQAKLRRPRGCGLSTFWIYEYAMKKILSIFLVLVWCIGIIGSAAGDRVWCIGSDGHSSVEASIGTHCAESSIASKTQNSSVSSSHCGSCKDMSLTSDSTAIFALAISVPAPVEKLVPAPLISTLLLTVPIADQPLSSFLEHRDSSSLIGWLLDHRSVVLLI